MMIRLDKYLADMQIGSRSEVKAYIRKGRVKVNNIVVSDPNLKVKEGDSIFFDDNIVTYEKHSYYMLNKPAGVVSATRDNLSETVLDCIKDKKHKDLFPVGRLDKDTEGLLLITNDGELAHRLLSPKRHVDKVYYATVKGVVNDDDKEAFAKGVIIGDNYRTLPASLQIIASAEISEIKLTIHEGKFHQVKQMFEAVGKEVIYLKRLSMGSLILDPKLKTGEYRFLTEEEIARLKEI
ncbi:MAG TPA: rRNA pseudouridine synthase [Clostridiales bacterium]|nr:rRNA pseudouridine synthase [Clostridiales bacterium]